VVAAPTCGTRARKGFGRCDRGGRGGVWWLVRADRVTGRQEGDPDGIGPSDGPATCWHSRRSAEVEVFDNRFATVKPSRRTVEHLRGSCQSDAEAELWAAVW